jgi:uncharacterized integral membrane protein
MDENAFRDADDRLQPEPRRPAGPSEGIPWGAVLLLIWAVALIIFSVQNAGRTTIEFLGWAWNMPVALLVMVTALTTLVVSGLVWPLYRRRRRKRREAERALRSDD